VVTRSAAEATLLELSRLDGAARRPRTEVWFPLLMFGLVDLGAVPVALTAGRGHLGPYFLPMNLLAGVLCAVHYRRVGRATGLQAPLFAWLGVVLAVSIAGVACSYEGRELGWERLNLAGPSISMALGYLVLAFWARSTTLLLAVTAMSAATVIVVSVTSGDVAIAWQVACFASTLLTLSLANRLTTKERP
jgi:hypothetical protein